MWHHLPPQQQRGAQLRRGEAPADAVAGREAQDHEQADALTSPDGEPVTGIDYPADPIERRAGDITPDAPDPEVEWDERVQPERADEKRRLTMGEYEPDDSRVVTQVAAEAPGEPPRTGPREDQARAEAQRREEGRKLEEESKPTARDAAGEKQDGFKEDSDEEARDRLRDKARSSLP